MISGVKCQKMLCEVTVTLANLIFFSLPCSPRPHFKQTPSLTLTLSWPTPRGKTLGPWVPEQLVQPHSLSEARATQPTKCQHKLEPWYPDSPWQPATQMVRYFPLLELAILVHTSAKCKHIFRRKSITAAAAKDRGSTLDAISSFNI